MGIFSHIGVNLECLLKLVVCPVQCCQYGYFISNIGCFWFSDIIDNTIDILSLSQDDSLIITQLYIIIYTRTQHFNRN